MGTAHGNTFWNDGRVGMLVSMWAEGYSGAQIALSVSREFGVPVTRSAVIGRANRMKLAPRVARGQPKTAEERRETRRLYEEKRRKTQGPVNFGTIGRTPWYKRNPVQAVPVPTESRNLPFLEISDGCLFATSPDEALTHIFCGQPKQDGYPYCTAHCRIAYRPVERPIYVSSAKAAA